MRPIQSRERTIMSGGACVVESEEINISEGVEREQKQEESMEEEYIIGIVHEMIGKRKNKSKRTSILHAI